MLTIALLRQNILMDFKSNPNPMKKVNPEDLVVGQEYYVKMKLSDKDSTDLPYCFEDIQGSIEWLPQDQPIYTAEPDNDRLKMVVGVASRMYVTRNLKPELCAREALELITACENELNKQS